MAFGRLQRSAESVPVAEDVQRARTMKKDYRALTRRSTTKIGPACGLAACTLACRPSHNRSHRAARSRCQGPQARGAGRRIAPSLGRRRAPRKTRACDGRRGPRSQRQSVADRNEARTACGPNVWPRCWPLAVHERGHPLALGGPLLRPVVGPASGRPPMSGCVA